MKPAKVFVTLLFLASVQNAIGQNSDIELLEKTVKLITGQNPVTNQPFTWTTCSSGNLFYESDTVTFYNQEYCYSNKKCFDYLSCRFTSINSIEITYAGLIYTVKQRQATRAEHLAPEDYPFPDSLINFNDSSFLTAEYIFRDKQTVINIYKRNSVLYTLRFHSLKEMTNPKDKSKYYVLKFIKDRFG